MWLPSPPRSSSYAMSLMPPEPVPPREATSDAGVDWCMYVQSDAPRLYMQAPGNPCMWSALSSMYCTCSNMFKLFHQEHPFPRHHTLPCTSCCTCLSLPRCLLSCSSLTLQFDGSMTRGTAYTASNTTLAALDSNRPNFSLIK